MSIINGHCRWRGCGKLVSGRRSICDKHFRELPLEHREALTMVTPGTQQHVRALEAALEWAREGKPA